MDSILPDFVKLSCSNPGTGDFASLVTVTGFMGISGLPGDRLYYSAYNIDAASNPAGSVEVGIGEYSTTGSTKIIRRKVIRSTNSNAIVNFSGNVHVIISSNARVVAPDAVHEHRLTLLTDTPITTTDQVGRTTLYYSPYIGNLATLYTGNALEKFRVDELSLILSGLTVDKLYDVFIFLSSAGAVLIDLGTAWTNDTTRALALSKKQGGILVNNASFTSLINGTPVSQFAATYIGTIRATGTGTTEDSYIKRFLWNRYNRVPRPFRLRDASGDYAYTTATWRNINNLATNRIQWIVGQSYDPVQIFLKHRAYGGSGAGVAWAGIGIDISGSTGPTVSEVMYGVGAAFDGTSNVVYNDFVSAGYHFAQGQEQGGASLTFSPSIAGNGFHGSVLG